MKKLIILAFFPIFCFAQKSDTTKKKPKFQYIRVSLTPEQYDTVFYDLSKTMAEYPYAVSGIRAFKSQVEIISVFDTVAVKIDSLSVKPKKTKKSK